MGTQTQDIEKKYRLADGVNRVSPKAKRPAIGFGFVMLNPEVENTERYCIETNTVSILTAEHELINRCLVTTAAMQEIKFPSTKNERGSLVVWATSPLSTVPVVIGVVRATNEKNTLAKSNSFQLHREKDGNHVIIEGIAEDGVINIFARGRKGGKINLKALNESLLAELDVYVQGKITIDAEDSIRIRTDKEFTVDLDTIEPTTQKEVKATVSYKMGQGFILNDEYGNKVTTHAKGVRVLVPKSGLIETIGDQNDAQVALLGNSTIKTLDSIFDQLNAISQALSTLTVNTQTGMVLPNVPAAMSKVKVKVKQLKKDLDKLKSKNVKLS